MTQIVQRELLELNEESVLDYGAKGDGIDDTAALLLAGLSGKKIHFPRGTYRVTSAIVMDSLTEFRGDGKDTVIVLDYSGASQSLLTANGAEGLVISDLTLDGGLDGTHTQGNAVVWVGVTDSRIERIHVQNSPRESILIRDASLRNTVRHCTFDRQGAGAGHIYFLTDCTDNEASFNHFYDSAGGCIWLSGRIMRTKIVGNSNDISDFELVGVRWDCGGGEIVGNTAQNCNDNGISVTGYGWSVVGNTARGNDAAGIAVYGSSNTVVGNTCIDNGKAGGSQHGGITIAAQFGGMAADNVISGNNIQRIAGATTEQYYGLRISSTTYSAWASSQVVTADTFRTNANKLYISTTAGTTGATPPTHTSGTVSDGAVSWLFIGLFQNTNARPAGNRVLGNKILGHTGGNIQRFGASPQGFAEEEEVAEYMRIPTAWAQSQVVVVGDMRTHIHSDGVPRYYRATTEGTTGATPPTHTSGVVSDGTVSWFFVGQGYYNAIRSATDSGVLIKAPMKIECVDTTSNPPTILAGTFLPEGVVTAANGSLYLRSNSTDNIAIYQKTGTTNTNVGWQLLASRIGGNTASRPSSPQPYMMYFDTTLNKPIWRDGGNANWRDATGTVV